MFKIVFSIIALYILSFPLYSQTFYKADFKTDEGKNEWNQYRTGKEYWTFWYYIDNVLNSGINHTFPTNITSGDTLKDWLVSPRIKFSNAKVKIKFSLVSFPKSQNGNFFQIMISRESRNPTDNSFVLIGDMSDENTGEENYIEKIFSIPSINSIDSGYFAIYYQATNNPYATSIVGFEVIGNTTEVEESSINEQLTVSTNNFSSSSTIEVNVNASNQNLIFSLYGINGGKVISTNLENGSNQIQTNRINSGIYLYSISSNGAIVKSGSLLLT